MFVFNSLDRDKNRLYTRQGKKSRACESIRRNADKPEPIMQTMRTMHTQGIACQEDD
ncbi:hypothetical protein BRPE64_ACDS26340 [Caballeronia insecticola]|uniref:Uncharacterized protein n=1 Tax=Caballeronia insecticola TaxID=758793 RepID=R4WIZ5_9BURK|nr:hypothetical protein BRPE64_ACDS26340 [Caballeronia insecticola]